MSTSSTVHNSQYWENFRITPADIEHLVNFLVDREHPETLQALAYEVVRYRHEEAMNSLRDILSQGQVYRPEAVYGVGEKVIFPHLNNALAEVSAVRPGHNPEYEPFSVMQVRMQSGVLREFVIDLKREHPLNTVADMPVEDLAVDDLYEQYGVKVQKALRSALEMNVQFLAVAERWFLRDLVMEISPGQLNIAEALLDMSGGGPTPTEAFLEDMDLPSEIALPLKIFSLENALLRDHRFDEVGPSGQGLWYLRRMEPKQVLETPPPLRYMPIPYNRGLLDETMLSLEKLVDDEWGDAAPDVSKDETVTVVLTYPHWRSKTLPLAARVARLFPTAHVTDRIMFSFVDGATQEEFPGWVVRSGRYVFGLADWYAKHEVGVGAYIDLKRDAASGRIVVNLRKIRARRREWLRTVTAEDGQLNFEVTRSPVSCEFDELAAVAVPDPDSVDALAEKLQRSSLESLMETAFGGLAGLSLQRAVHGVTLYSVLNLLRRVAPAPMLAALAASSRYVSLGDNYWAYRGEES
ncbi:MAG TPA: hypothetical protein PKH77_20605 [Anaerolineae bacterium]|nr:hypothetical protein [Anaerolineae bacterium]